MSARRLGELGNVRFRFDGREFLGRPGDTLAPRVKVHSPGHWRDLTYITSVLTPASITRQPKKLYAASFS